jgi:hypothetical protein
VSLEGSLYNGDLLAASGGQTLGGPYTRFPTLASAGPMTMTFNNESTGTLVWPGGTVPIQRFNIVPNGLTAPPVPATPESGWWWNEAEPAAASSWSGRTARSTSPATCTTTTATPVWYLTVGEIGGRRPRAPSRQLVELHRRADAHRRVAAEHAQQLERRADDDHLQRARRGDNDPT